MILGRDERGRFLGRWTNDPFDPRGWPPDEECRIWLDPENGIFCVVDEVDFQWALQWAWSATPNSTRLKWYATRSTRLRGSDGPQVKVYLHKEILLRHAGPAPSEKHIIGDHLDGDSLNDRRGNLRWATPKENRHNRGGAYLRQLQMRV